MWELALPDTLEMDERFNDWFCEELIREYFSNLKS
jgi:hypothetical protein